MRVTIVGCAGSYPSAQSPASCYLLEHDGHAIVLDLGNGSLGALQNFIALEAISAVFISHLHVDHFIDLTSFYVYRKYHPNGPLPAIPVFGPRDTAGRLARAYGLAEDPGMSSEFEFREFGLHDEPAHEGARHVEVEIGPFSVTAARVAHPVEAYGFRVSAGGRTVAYSGDTGPTPVLVELARDADIALFEAAYLDGDHEPGVHLTAREAGQLAASAGVGHLVLTHLVAWNDVQATATQGAQGFGAEVTLAHPHLIL
jgi:ribonuclease BN (tRNA processing enzyme)